MHTAATHRRRGIASALLSLALSYNPVLGYSANHTPEGAAWGRSRGLQVPEPSEAVDEAEVAWAAASVYLYLSHVTEQDVLWRRPLPVPRWSRLTAGGYRAGDAEKR